jgi:TolB-like protein
LPDKPSIAVLPFANLSGDPAQDYLADGLTDNLLDALAQNPGLFVIARNATLIYRGKAAPPRAVAKDLGVRYVLEGSVQKSGDHIRVTAQLIDAVKRQPPAVAEIRSRPDRSVRARGRPHLADRRHARCATPWHNLGPHHRSRHAQPGSVGELRQVA